MTPEQRAEIRAEMMRWRFVSVVCPTSGKRGSGKPHRRPVNVIRFVSEDGGEWAEVEEVSATERRRAAERDARRGSDDEPLGVLIRGPKTDRPERVARLTRWNAEGREIRHEQPGGRGLRLGPGSWDDLLPPLRLADELTPVTRLVFPVKCPRCLDGRDRRAEKLGPVLDLLHAAGQLSVTITEFWAVADRWDDTHRQSDSVNE